MYTVEMEKIENVLKDFYNLTKFKIVLYDQDRNILCSYPKHMCTFCATVRTCPSLEKKCLGCDNVGFDICDRTRKPYVYKCHMSITEAIAPIYANEINIGYLMFGQILGGGSSEVRTKAREAERLYGILLSEEMISEMISVDEDYVKSAVNMMTMCANYLYTNEIIRNNPNIFVYQLKDYIGSHLDADITLDSLIKHFYISRTKLYHISKENFGMGISDYIRLERIKAAKRLLRNTNYSVSVIASKVGIQDTNYFIRIFKNVEGTTPLKYRKAHSAV